MTMRDLTSPVASPCNSVCRISAATGLCEGCFRRLDEIADWSRMDDHEKRAVWVLIDERRREASASGTARDPSLG